MNGSVRRNAVIGLVLGSMGLAAGCSGANVDGKYRDAQGAVKMELKDGKAAMDIGPVHIDAKYSVDGDKLTITPAAGPNPDAIALTIGKDGSLTATTPNPLFEKLVKTN
jgi:hypothetical protein